MQATNRVRIAVTITSLVIAALLIGLVDRSPAIPATLTIPTVKTQSFAPMVGVATGELHNGLAVYRLPAVEVTETRSQALARIAQEEVLAMK